MNTDTEIWKDITHYKGFYQVSNLGRIKSLERYFKNPLTGKILIKEKIRVLRESSNGYLRCNLSKNGTTKTHQIHKLVAIAFLNHKPNKHKTIVDHIDNNRTNNNLSNLQLISQRENASKDRKNGSSDLVGVTWHKATGKWQANIYAYHRYNYLGVYKTQQEAKKAYDKALKQVLSNKPIDIKIPPKSKRVKKTADTTKT